MNLSLIMKVILWSAILGLFPPSPTALCQTASHSSDCSTLKRPRHKVSCLCGTVEVCSGDICVGPAAFDLDEDIGVELRNKLGTTILESRKAPAETHEKEGKTQDGKKVIVKIPERAFCFEGKRDGDYWLAFILYKDGTRQSTVMFPTTYSHKLRKPCDSVYMVEPPTCPK